MTDQPAVVIFDKDGTLVCPHSGEKFVQHPRDQRILDGADKAVKNFQQRGFKLAIASNQPGVEAGHKTLEDAVAEMRYALSLFPEIEFGLFCPDFAGQDAWAVSRGDKEELSTNCFPPGDDEFEITFRKPSPGMLIWICDFFDATLEKSWMVGDRPEDSEAAECAGINFMDAALVRQRFTPGLHSFDVDVAQLELLEPRLEGMYRVAK